ncbi:DUF262 domain-containing protein [Synechococcus sp. CS-205]|uniref:GmrSD restriction endonuclease domain-containing protein n=1 Tax=Synechococcus sp. CS-205 TaxID=2847984 RepID=UPI00223A83F7|nr:DUF262 domain-containing protein [Synechococcus sp. CS-205]MCT0247737.1 DUF262 domain-containing protein [Synechococcus sp. CS-205]
MATQRYSVTPHPIDTLLTWVKSGEIAIPEIQRPFVWEATKVRNLLDSLYQGFPVGYLIAWRNPTVKLKDGTTSAGKRILIDGQQRVTALMASLLGMEVLTKDYASVRIRIANEFVTEIGIKAGRLRIFPEGTLLVAMYGEGKTRGQVSELGIAATINQACAAIHSPKELHLMPFIKIALKANYLEMRQLAEGGNQPNLNLSKIKDFPIRVPPKDEVFEICDQVESLFSLADQLEAKLTAARKFVDRLTPALLAKAFRGELVPQDPNDEPASMLLERILAVRQADSARGKTIRSRRSGTKGSRTKTASITNMLKRDQIAQNHLSSILMECGPLSAEALLSASQLEIDDFYDQLRDEEANGFLRENRGDSSKSPRVLEHVV